MRNTPPFSKLLKVRSIVRVFASLFSGGLLYVAWLVVFLWIDPQDGALEVLLWISAPLVTGIGFGLGVYFFNKACREDQGGFLRITTWSLTGCTLGALAVYWFGPMLIVFSMLAAGTLSIMAREILHGWRE